jgi:hypothetical protein
MIIEKEIISKIARDYIFLTGTVDVDIPYFKKKIEEGVITSDINYQTNVYGKHTPWEFFNKDEKFRTIILQFIDYLESAPINLDKFFLSNAWGIIEKFGEYTKKHHHNPCYLSGVLYLNSHSQKLYFPEIHQEITPKQGKFALFSSTLQHYTKRNIKQKAKYAISFNFTSAGV